MSIGPFYFARRKGFYGEKEKASKEKEKYPQTADESSGNAQGKTIIANAKS